MDNQDIIQEDLAKSLSKINVESVLPVDKRKELIKRFTIVKSSFLDRLNGKEFYVFSNTFNEAFIEVLSFILPQSLEALFENELMSAMNELNARFLKKYAFAFVAEAKHFLLTNPDVYELLQKDNGGQAYRLVKKSSPTTKLFDMGTVLNIG